MNDAKLTTDGKNALPRIIAAHRAQRPPAPDRAPGLERAWGRALRHAAMPFEGMQLAPAEVSAVLDAGLEATISALPETGILMAIEADGGARGLLALDHGALDVLIEVQTTGRVEASQLPPRRVTRIDAALCRDFIDLSLAAFAQEATGIDGRDWPARMAFGSVIEDRDRLTLLLPEQAFHVVPAALRLGAGGLRGGRAVLVLPVDATGRPSKPGDRPAVSVPPGWSAGLAEALSDAPLPLEAVLVRLTRPLGEVEAWAEGDLLPFDRADLTAVTLEAPDGTMVQRGALGQIGGRRALRVQPDDAMGRDAATPPPPEQNAFKAPAGPTAPPPAVASPELHS